MIDAPPSSTELVEAVLARFGAGALAVAQRAGVRVSVLAEGERFGDRSPALRRIAAGGGVYLSGVDPRIRRAFAGATAFVTPYAASACDEYFAECVRAFVEVNDPHSLWPRATRDRLWSVDPRMAAIIASLFEFDLVA